MHLSPLREFVTGVLHKKHLNMLTMYLRETPTKGGIPPNVLHILISAYMEAIVGVQLYIGSTWVWQSNIFVHMLRLDINDEHQVWSI